MGVHGLWRLLDSFGQVTQPENWRGRRVAIDASIWLAQFRAQTKPGCDADHQILEGFLARMLKLMFYGIQPVFVFDGPATSAKSAEHRRRQVRRTALSQQLLKRRAQQIMLAQVSAGALKVAELPRRVDEREEGNASGETARTEKSEHAEREREDKAPAAATKEEEEEEAKAFAALREKQGSSSLQRNCRRGVQKARRLAPDRVSQRLTRLFLNDAGEYIASRKKGERRLFENMLRNTSSSLFMGSRRTFSDEANAPPPPPPPPPPPRGKLHRDHVVDVEREGDSVDVDVDGDCAVDTVTIPSSEISIQDSPSDDASDREDSVELCFADDVVVPHTDEKEPVTASHGRESSTESITRHVNAFLQSFVTPPAKRTRAEDASGAEACIAVDDDDDDDEDDGEHDDNDGEDDGSESSPSYSGDEDALLLWALEEDLNADDDATAFLWHPNTQIGGPPLSPVASTTPAAFSQTSHTSSEFVPVKELDGKGSSAAPVLSDMRFPVPTSVNPTSEKGKGAAARASGNGRASGRSPPPAIPFDLLELVELLDCCGVPFVLSPAEADAQCALLAREGLVDAVFTEDSDVVVHGAPIVLRGFFASNRHVVEYPCNDLATCGVDKKVLVALAYLLGCDYTEGVAGIGLAGALDAVTASWPSPKESTDAATPDSPQNREAEGVPDVRFVCGLLERWHRICADQPSSWAATAGDDLSLLQYSIFDAHRQTWGSASVPPGFPDREVAEAFFTPKVDEDKTPFTATAPDWQRMRAFAAGHGLLSSSWVVQRFELAQREWTTKHAEQFAEANGVDSEGRRQRRLDDFGVKTRTSAKWAFKKQPPQQAAALARLRAVRHASGME